MYPNLSLKTLLSLPFNNTFVVASSFTLLLSPTLSTHSHPDKLPSQASYQTLTPNPQKPPIIPYSLSDISPAAEGLAIPLVFLQTFTASSRKQSFQSFHTFSHIPRLFPRQSRSRLNSFVEDGFCLSLFQFLDHAPFHRLYFTLYPYSSLQVEDTYKQHMCCLMHSSSTFSRFLAIVRSLFMDRI